jgi:hypothetical protein
MHPAGFEAVIPASGRLQTHALDSANTGIGLCKVNYIFNPQRHIIIAMSEGRSCGTVYVSYQEVVGRYEGFSTKYIS